MTHALFLHLFWFAVKRKFCLCFLFRFCFFFFSLCRLLLHCKRGRKWFCSEFSHIVYSILEPYTQHGAWSMNRELSTLGTYSIRTTVRTDYDNLIFQLSCNNPRHRQSNATSMNIAVSRKWNLISVYI